MFGGGILCSRRHSEATPSMKPKASGVRIAPITTNCHTLHTECFFGPSVQKLRPIKGIVLKGVDAEDEDLFYTGERVVFGGGRYEYADTAMSFIGRGSYGTVYRGILKDVGRRKTVAVKKMWRLNVKEDELEAMKCVRSEHLVELLDICEEAEDITYLVMEYCNNDLDRHLRCIATDGRLCASEMATVVESIARGYHALYEKHIVHRDIKPQNILLVYGPDTNDKTIVSAKITDFGVSRVLADETMGLSNVAGTLYYMAPEVGANLVTISEYNAEADMWSIGCLIFQCLTGKIPFDEAALCRLFLYCAGGNFDAYEVPDLPANTDKYLQLLITGLLEIDRRKRATPCQLFTAVNSSELTLEHVHNFDENKCCS